MKIYMKEEKKVEVVVVVVVVITTECVHRRIGQQETGNFREISEAKQDKECLAPLSDLYYFFSHHFISLSFVLLLKLRKSFLSNFLSTGR